MSAKKAVVLLSGGLDSATVLYLARRQGYKTFCLIFDYGQRHRKEILQAKKLAQIANSPYEIIKFKLPWKGSSLVDHRKKIPQKRSFKEIGGGIPSTYVPARNTLFIAFAVSCAEAIGADTVFIGAHSLDFSGYPDCRPHYFKIYDKLIAAGTKVGKIKINAPLLKKTKAEIIKIGTSLGVPYKITWSCYSGKKKICGVCDSCLLRKKGFKEAGIKDPLERYICKLVK